MHQALIDLLTSDPRVSNPMGDRVWWLRRPQRDDALPAATLTQVGGFRDRHLSGASGLVEAGVQVDVWATTYRDAKEAMAGILAVVNAYRHPAGGEIQGIFIDAERDLTDADIADGRLLFRVSADLTIQHTE